MKYYTLVKRCSVWLNATVEAESEDQAIEKANKLDKKDWTQGEIDYSPEYMELCDENLNYIKEI